MDTGKFNTEIIPTVRKTSHAQGQQVRLKLLAGVKEQLVRTFLVFRREATWLREVLGT